MTTTIPQWVLNQNPYEKCATCKMDGRPLQNCLYCNKPEYAGYVDKSARSRLVCNL